ncbi:hypothetical protein BaRGS_00005700 [Batillaria attramentaria]|uniref:Uncharacterized protein n=1 Tax=Batillaria attramentaria TaxID=370345 RepID=A0ABD0LTY9_9CAEN
MRRQLLLSPTSGLPFLLFLGRTNVGPEGSKGTTGQCLLSCCGGLERAGVAKGGAIQTSYMGDSPMTSVQTEEQYVGHDSDHLPIKPLCLLAPNTASTRLLFGRDGDNDTEMRGVEIISARGSTRRLAPSRRVTQWLSGGRERQTMGHDGTLLLVTHITQEDADIKPRAANLAGPDLLHHTARGAVTPVVPNPYSDSARPRQTSTRRGLGDKYCNPTECEISNFHCPTCTTLPLPFPYLGRRSGHALPPGQNELQGDSEGSEAVDSGARGRSSAPHHYKRKVEKARSKLRCLGHKLIFRVLISSPTRGEVLGADQPRGEDVTCSTCKVMTAV